MAFVVTKTCIGCKDTACVVVCPAECFHEGPEMLYINPESCVDCEACVSECPAEAIFHDEEVPAENFADIELNARMSQVFPSINRRK